MLRKGHTAQYGTTATKSAHPRKITREPVVELGLQVIDEQRRAVFCEII